MATKAAGEVAKGCGYDVIVWSHALQGEARDIGHFYAKIASDLVSKKQVDLEEMRRFLASVSVSVPYDDIVKLSHILASTSGTIKLCVISGGEPTVTVRGCGTGGRNQELALSFAKHSHIYNTQLETVMEDKVLFCSVGSDGQDGPTDAAGASVDASSWKNAIEQGLDPDTALANNDSHILFSTLSGGVCLIKTGLTGTNVMDMHVLMIDI